MQSCVCWSNDSPSWGIWYWTKIFLSTKIRSNVPRRSQAKEMKFFLPWAILATDTLSTCTISIRHYYWLLLILLFLECNPRIGHLRQFSDCLLIHASHTLLEEIRGLWSRSEDCEADPRIVKPIWGLWSQSEDCEANLRIDMQSSKLRFMQDNPWIVPSVLCT